MNPLRIALMHASLLIMNAAHLARYFVSFLAHEKGVVNGVRVIAERDGKIVLVRHWYAPFVWTLPGGGIDRGEDPHSAAVREVLEETGLVIHGTLKTLGVTEGFLGKNDRTTYLHAANPSGDLAVASNLEIMERAWFSAKELPIQTTPNNRKYIEQLLVTPPGI